ARPEYVEFLLYEESSFVGDWLLGVANVYDAPGKRDFFHGGAERLRQANRFHHHIRATAIGKLTEAVVQRLGTAVDGEARACFSCHRQLTFVDVDGNRRCAC